MNTFDWILLWLSVALGFLAAALRIALARKKGRPLGLGWTVHSFVFPVLLLLALILLKTGTADIVFPAMVLALAEELIVSLLRRRRDRQNP